MKFNYQPYTQLANAQNKNFIDSRVDENGQLVEGEKKVEAEPMGYGFMGGNTLGANQNEKIRGIRPPKLFSSKPKAELLTQEKADILTDDTSAPSGKGSFGDKAMEASGEIMNMGLQTYGNFQNTAGSSKESQAQILQGTVQGASIGMKVGGPWGALAGAGIGAGINILDAKRDKMKRMDLGNTEAKEDFLDIKNDRKQAYYNDTMLS